MVQHKIAKGKSVHAYTSKISELERLLAINQRELQLAEAEQQQLELRELILLDVVHHQEALNAALQRCQELKKLGSGSYSSSQSSSPQTSENTASLTSHVNEQLGMCSLLHSCDGHPPATKHLDRPFADIPGHSYILQLLQNASMQQTQQILNMTADSWIAYFQNLYIQLAALLNISAHATAEDWVAVSAASPQTGVPLQKAASGNSRAVSTNTAIWQHSISLPTQQSFSSRSALDASQQQQDAAQTTHASGASSAGLSEPSHVSSSPAVATAHSLGSSLPQSVPGVNMVDDMLRLNYLVDECFTFILLASILTPDIIVEVMCTHLGTRQRFGHTPTMKKVIANNLKLTPGQARQLAACYEQFRTIHVTNNAKYMQLANKASDVGFMVAAAAAEKNQASLAAAAASVAGGPAVQQMQPQASRPTKSRSTGQGYDLSGDQNHSNGSAGVQGASQQPHVSPPITEAAAEDGNRLHQRLQGDLYRRLILQGLEYMFVTNTLTYLQKATLLVSSYPLPFVVTATAEAVKQTLERCAAGNDKAAGDSSQSSFTDSAAGCGDDAGMYWRCMQEDHEQRHNALLQEQRQRWWKELQDDWGFML